MYLAVKGGERAIARAHELLAEERRGDPAVPELNVAQIEAQLSHAVDRVMAEGSVYDRELAALAIKQACGDVVEAIFLLRAYRTTLPRFAVSEPLNTECMVARRRISTTFKDVPGGQLLGATFDYTHRLLDFGLATPMAHTNGQALAAETADRHEVADFSRVVDLPTTRRMIEREPPDEPDQTVRDLTREPAAFPAERSTRLQALARADEGFLLGLGHSTQYLYEGHPFVAEIRQGAVPVEIVPEELGFPLVIGEIIVTECEMIDQFMGTEVKEAQFTRGYGLAYGNAERKAMAMALVERAMRCRELGEEITSPVQDEEFVLENCDNVAASGFVQHLKLPHYADFQSELIGIRVRRNEINGPGAVSDPATGKDR